MDSVTQFALGAAIGEAVLGRQTGRRAALTGGILATLPDLDAFIPWQDAVASFTYHRSASHSLLVLSLASPLIAWLILKFKPALARYRRRLYLMVFLALFTHPLLDAFTVYGTQLFWPLTDYPVSGSTIFIVDPAYTLWLLIGVISALAMQRNINLGHRLNTAGLVLSSAYLAWTVAAKLMVDDAAARALDEQELAFDRVMTTPAPFNTLVWRIIGIDRNGYFDGYYTLGDSPGSIVFTHYSSQPEYLAGLDDHWPVTRLQRFTHGFYRVTRRDSDILVADLRMGLEPAYIFQFKVAEFTRGVSRPVTATLSP